MDHNDNLDICLIPTTLCFPRSCGVCCATHGHVRPRATSHEVSRLVYMYTSMMDLGFTMSQVLHYTYLDKYYSYGKTRMFDKLRELGLLWRSTVYIYIIQTP